MIWLIASRHSPGAHLSAMTHKSLQGDVLLLGTTMFRFGFGARGKALIATFPRLK